MKAAALAAVAFLAACPSYHAAKLPGTPASATFVEVDGVSVHYRDQGQGPAVVLIHGYGASLESWAGVAPVLAATDGITGDHESLDAEKPWISTTAGAVRAPASR